MEPLSATEIFGVPYRIIWKKGSEVDMYEGGFLRGQIRYEKREICIAKDMLRRDQLLTLVEEIIHGILMEMEEKELNSNHKFINIFANGFFTALEKAGMLRNMNESKKKNQCSLKKK